MISPDYLYSALIKKPVIQLNSLLFTVGLLLTVNISLFSQSVDNTLFTYVSPFPQSGYNPPSTNIIVRLTDQTEIGPLFPSDLISVNGEKSGKGAGEIILSDDGKTFIIKPFNNFEPGEKVTVTLSGLAKQMGKLYDESSFSFYISDRIITQKEKYALKLFLDESGITEKEYKKLVRAGKGDPLPVNFPEIEVKVFDNPYESKLFFGIFGSTNYPSTMIVGNDLYPFYYNELPSAAIDFKKQPDGTLTYFDTDKDKFYALNSKYEIVDSFFCGNGFETDLHELLVQPNGNSYLLGLDPRIVDMSLIVPGGREDAMVIGFLIQELDKQKNVIFQWRSLDYIPITDAAESIDLTAQTIDYIHSNAICVDFDGNLLLSSRHLNEITKINRQTGRIIWRLGGKANQFTFLNENYEFSYQHDIRRLDNGNIILFDNGNLRSPQFSRAVEYELDETDYTARLIWEYRNSPDYFASAMGSARRLPNGNTLINWVRGGFITEVRPDGSKALELKYPENFFSYRVLKDDWRSTAFTTNTDVLDFGEIEPGKSVIKAISVKNNTDNEIAITGIYHSLDEFIILSDFPVVIPGGKQHDFEIEFIPSGLDSFTDILNIRSDTKSSVINYQMTVTGTGSFTTSVDNQNTSFSYRLFNNYPNPFNPSTVIKYEIARKSFVTVEIYDVLGNKVSSLENSIKDYGVHEVAFNPDNLSSGAYFYSVTAKDTETGYIFKKTEKMIYIK
jgi:hypothetical protein